MNKLNHIAIMILLTMSLGVSAQTMSYQTDKDESQNMNIMANFSLLDMNLGFPTISFGAGADADLYVGRFSAEANYHFTYWDGKKSIIKGTNESMNNLRNYSSFRLGGRFHFVDKKGTHKMKAVLSTDYRGTSTVTTYLPMKVPCRSIVGLHFGVENYNTVVKARRDSSILTKEGQRLSEWASGTNMNVAMVYGGFSFIKIMKATMSAGGSHWNFKWYRNAYIDFLYAPLISIQDIMVGGKTYVVEGSGTRGFIKNAVGARFGMNVMAKPGMGIRYEIGFLPGLSRGRGLYTVASFGIPLIRQIKLKKGA